MREKIVLRIPLTKLPLSQNDQRRAHWTTVRDAKILVETLVLQALKESKVGPIEGPVTVRLVWYAPDAKRRDVDSMAPMLKACLDALTTKWHKRIIIRKGVLDDDHSGIIQEAILGPVIVARDDPRFELQIMAGTGVMSTSGS